MELAVQHVGGLRVVTVDIIGEEASGSAFCDLIFIENLLRAALTFIL